MRIPTQLCLNQKLQIRNFINGIAPIGGAVARGPDGLSSHPPSTRHRENADGSSQVWDVLRTGQHQTGTGQDRPPQNQTQTSRYVL